MGTVGGGKETRKGWIGMDGIGEDMVCTAVTVKNKKR